MGRVYLRGGDVVQAVVGLVEGEKALFRLLAWERGSFEFTPVPVTIDSRIETPTRALLREGRRQLDEWERTATNLPPLEAHVALRIRTERLPNVIHPLTQEVLVVLELYTRVRDVVDHCSYPDYQVLRTLQTLIARGMLEQRRDSAVSEIPRDARFFSSSHASRLREWLAASQPRGGSASDAVNRVGATSSSRLSRGVGNNTWNSSIAVSYPHSVNRAATKSVTSLPNGEPT